jgi:hypothetical protein
MAEDSSAVDQPDGIREVLKQVIRVILGARNPDQPGVPEPFPPLTPMELSEWLGQKARTAGFDPVHFERGAKVALAEIERAAASKHAAEAHESARVALDRLEPDNDAHGAGIGIVREAMRGLGSYRSFGSVSGTRGASKAR